MNRGRDQPDLQEKVEILYKENEFFGKFIKADYQKKKIEELAKYKDYVKE